MWIGWLNSSCSQTHMSTTVKIKIYMPLNFGISYYNNISYTISMNLYDFRCDFLLTFFRPVTSRPMSKELVNLRSLVDAHLTVTSIFIVMELYNGNNSVYYSAYVQNVSVCISEGVCHCCVLLHTRASFPVPIITIFIVGYIL